jgi:hypothetical protein
MRKILPGREILDDPYYRDVEKRIQTISLILGCGILLCSWVFLSPMFAWSFLLGGLISHLNFRWMKQGVDHLLAMMGDSVNSSSSTSSELKNLGGPGPGESQATGLSLPSTRAIIFKYFLRYALMGVSLYAIFRFRFFDVKGAVLGLCLFILAVMVECIHQAVRTIIEDIQRGRT